MAILNPTQLSAEAQVIATETAQGANTAIRIGQMYQDIIDSGAYTVKVSLSSAEILQLFTTPKELIAAPGAGKVINTLQIFIKLNYNSVQYTGNNMQIRINGTSLNLIDNAFYKNIEDRWFFAFPLPGQSLIDPSNQALIFTVDSANPTSGNSTMDCYITYNIISL